MKLSEWARHPATPPEGKAANRGQAGGRPEVGPAAKLEAQAIPKRPPAYEPQSHGSVENAVNQVKGMVRARMQALHRDDDSCVERVLPRILLVLGPCRPPEVLGRPKTPLGPPGLVAGRPHARLCLTLPLPALLPLPACLPA